MSGAPRVIVVTGASDGIGAEMARQWAKRHGERVALVLAARDEAKLAGVELQCAAAGARTLARHCDVGVQRDCRGLVDATLEAFGRIDVLVNNAGMSAHARFDETEDLGWTETLMRINHWGSVWCTQAALPHLKASRGRIVAVSSLLGLVGMPYRSAYCATKFAMTGFFEALRGELRADGISVTIAYPGVVATQLRHRGYDASGRPAGRSGLEERGAMSVETCARLIVDGAERRRRDVVMTAEARLGRWVKLVAPSLIDRLALGKLAKR